jgi:hypothetical protein
MTTQAAFEKLQQDVAYLMDRSAILDCISSHARGHDRHDVALMTAAYHTDGTDEHGYAINAGPEYAKWANAAHAAGSLLHTHNITTHTCEINGETAYCESYVLVVLLNRDGATARMISGRYIDQLERRGGDWKIKLRRTTVDVLLSGDASILNTPIFKQQGYTRGARDISDISYQRPLDLEQTPERW